MARNEIADKIQLLIDDGKPWSEAKAVYLMVETRKLLDYRREDGRPDLTHLRFYCDWVVHISKDRTDAATIEVLKTLQSQVQAQIRTVSQIAAVSATDFAYFESMQSELSTFLSDEGIDTTNLRRCWSEFVSILVKALENQPLTIDSRHGLNISKITFLPAAPGCVILHVDFVAPVGRFAWFELKNVY
jgi:hypothetical protein